MQQSILQVTYILQAQSGKAFWVNHFSELYIAETTQASVFNFLPWRYCLDRPPTETINLMKPACK